MAHILAFLVLASFVWLCVEGILRLLRFKSRTAMKWGAVAFLVIGALVVAGSPEIVPRDASSSELWSAQGIAVVVLSPVALLIYWLRIGLYKLIFRSR